MSSTENVTNTSPETDQPVQPSSTTKVASDANIVEKDPLDSVLEVNIPSEIKSESANLEKEPLDPVLEMNESVVSQIFDRPTEIGEFDEIPPKIFSLKDVYEPLTIPALNNAIYELGVVNMCWPKIFDPVFEFRVCFPQCYYTNNNKERLLLSYAENFRRQLHFHYKKTRKPFLLQAPNECGLQKMVCTTIRPTKLCFTGTNTWQGVAELVGDYFVYEPLSKPLLLVSTL